MQPASRAILGLLLFALVPVTLLPQESSGELRVSVVNFSHEPIRALQVVLRGAGTERTAYTDNTGLYRFDAVPAGVYELTIGAGPFYTITIQTVRIQRDSVYVLPPVEFVFDVYDCNARIPAYLRPLNRFDTNRGALGGTIVDSHNRALSEAKVTLFVPNAGISYPTITDREGRFLITDIPLRPDYRIEVVRDGYFTEEFTDFKMQVGYEAVYDRLSLEPCERGRCQPSLKPIRVLGTCQ